MFRDFAESDIVWCQGPKSDFLPGKVVVEESSGEWKKDDQVFVEVFQTGPGRRPKGRWLNVSDVIFFDVANDDETKFDKAGLNKAYNLAKKEFLENGKRAAVKVKRCKASDATKTPTQKAKRGRPSKSAGGKSSIKKEKKVCTRMLRGLDQKNQMNATVSDDEEEEEEDDIDDESKAKFAETNKNFLDDISSEDDDDDKENDDWTPSAGDKENFRPMKKRFVFKKSKADRKPFAPLLPMPKEEPSEYEKIQDRRRLEQRQMLESMRLAACALTKSITPNPFRPKKIGGSAHGPAHRRRSAPVQYSTRQQPPRTRSKLNLAETSFSEFRSPTKRTLFEEDGENDDYVAAKRGRNVRAHPTRWIRDPNSDFLKVEDVTEDMLANVSDYVSEKIYDQVFNSLKASYVCLN